MVVLTLPVERDARTTNSTFVVLENTAKLQQVSKRTSSSCRERIYHFLLHCFYIQISENTMAGQRNINFLKQWIDAFHG